MTPRLHACQQALELTQQMLAAAQAGHWDALDALQSALESALQPLHDHVGAAGPGPGSAELAHCLTELLQRQSELSLRVAQRKDELSGLLSAHQAGRRMSQVYGRVSSPEELL